MDLARVVASTNYLKSTNDKIALMDAFASANAKNITLIMHHCNHY
jgi:hypothetical protein